MKQTKRYPATELSFLTFNGKASISFFSIEDPFSTTSLYRYRAKPSSHSKLPWNKGMNKPTRFTRWETATVTSNEWSNTVHSRYGVKFLLSVQQFFNTLTQLRQGKWSGL